MSHPRFLVVVPTHRTWSAQPTINALKESFTYPTDFYQLDGTPSKVHAINKALREVLDVERHQIYVTVDDDILLPSNWQHFIACAFDRIPKLGVCGIDYAGSAEGEALVAEALRAPVQKVKDIQFRNTIGFQSVAGGNMAMPARVAKQVGPYPLTDDGRQYHMDEDGWRCHRAASLGYLYGYVIHPVEKVRFVTYSDSPEYVEQKKKDIAKWKENPVWPDKG